MTTRSSSRWSRPRFTLSSRPVRRPRLRVETLEDRTVPTSYSWTAAVSGNFNDSTKWTPVGVPAAGDDATISQSGITVTSPATTTVQSLTNAGTLSVSSGTTFTVTNGGSDSGTISVASGGSFDLTGGTLGWTAGTISGAGTFKIEIPGTLALAGASTKTLDTVTLNNLGTVTFGGTSDLRTGNSATIANAGTFNITADADIAWSFGSLPTFTNTGTVTKSSGLGLSSGFAITFNNSGGTITVTTGELDLAAGTSTGGTYNVAPGSILDLTGGGTQNYTGTFSGSGGGTVRLGSGTINVTLTNATFNFPASLFQWSGGTIGGISGSTLTNSGTMTLTGSGNKDLSTVLLANSGTVNLTGAGPWRTGTTTVTNNGTIDFQSDADLTWGFGSLPNLNNSGTVKKSGGTGESSIATAVNNNASGIFTVNSGQLTLAGGNSSGGTYNVAAGSILDLTGGGTQTYTGTFTGSGAGTVRFGSGTISIPLTNATFNFPAGLFQWTGGTISGLSGSTLTNTGTMTLAGGSNKDLSTVALANSGTIDVTGSGPWRTGTTTVTNNGAIDFQSDTDLTWGFGSQPTLSNSGTVMKSGGIGTTSVGVIVNNNAVGTISSQSGALSLDAGGSSTGAFAATAGNTVQLTTSYTLNAGASSSGAGQLALTNNTLTVAAPTTVQNLYWTGGGIAATAGLTVNGTLTTAGGNNHDFTGTITNNGTATLNGTGSLRLGDGATFQNNGSFTFLSDVWVTWGFGSSGNTFNNTGTLTKTSGSPTGTSGFNDVALNNSGTVNVASGVLYSDSGNDSGLINVAAGAKMAFTQDVSYLYPGAAFTGDGMVQLTGGGDLAVNTPVTVSRLLIDSDPSTLFGPATLTVDKQFTWTTGTVAGHVTVGPGATLSISGGGVKRLDTGVLTNDGTATMAGTASIQMANGATFQNNGSFTFLADVAFYWAYGSSGNIFNNAGTLTKTSGSPTGTSGFDNLVLNNSGTVNVASGVLYADGGNDSGLFNVAAGATMAFTQDVSYLYPGAAFTGDGTVQLTGGGDLAVNTPVTVSRLLIDSDPSTLFGPATLTVDKQFTWTTGTVAGHVTVGPGATLSISGGGVKRLDTGVLTNDGTATMAGTASIQMANGATFQNSGAFAFLSDVGFYWAYGSSGNTFKNAGTLSKSGGSGSTTFPSVLVDNSGIAVASSGTLNFNGGVAQMSGNTLNGGTWQANPAATLALPANVTTNAATVILNGAGSTIPQINGMTTNNGTFRVTGGRNFSTTGALTNNGTIRVGPLSTVTVAGAFTQTASGTFVSEIADQPASGQFGQLNATGAATLDGTVQVDLVNGFGPTAGGNFQIMSYASESGNFTFVSPSSPKQGDLFAPVVNPTNLIAQSIVNASDLAVTDIFVPATATPGLDAGIGYVVKNLSTTATVVTDWVDSVYLSKDNVLDPSDVLVQRVSHSGTLNAGDTYNGQTTVALPGINTGEYHVIVIADGRSFVPDTNRSNNTLTAPATLNVTVPVINIGQPVNGTIANGEDIYYRVDLPPGKTVKIATTFGVASEMEMYVGYKYVPTRTSFDQSTFPIGDTSGQIILPSTQAGPYYILLHGRESAAAGNSFTLQADIVPFGILGLDNAKGSNVGKATVTIHGAGFTPSTTARLVSGPVIRNASQVLFKDANTIYATFDLTGLGTGAYDLTAIDGASVDTKVAGFTVTTGNPGRLEFHVSAPAITRALTASSVTVDYANVGDTDVPAPLLDLTADWAVMRLPEQEDYVGKTVQFLGINPDGPAGILPAGFRGSITFQAKSVSAGAHVGITYDLRVASDNAPIDWASYKAEMRPESIAVDAWDAVFANFVAQVGPTTVTYRQAMADNATYLSQFGEYTYDLNRLLFLEYMKANADISAGTLDQTADAAMPSPGLSLTFERTYNSTIAGRYAGGRLGRGWTDNWDIYATTDANGNATIHQNGIGVFYTRNADGTYSGNSGNFNTLTLSAGKYQLRFTDGTIEAFRTDGKVDYIQDTNGNRITAAYDGNGRLITLTHTSGASLMLDYNAQGRLSTVTDSAGRVSSYTYDASGEHLATYTDKFGATNYSYYAGADVARLHALTQIAYSDNSHIYFTYDANGRLIDLHRDVIAGNPQEDLTYTYGTIGAAYSLTDAAGGQTQVFFDDKGNARRLVDARGLVSQFTYCDCGSLRGMVRPDGTTYTYDYDEHGNLTRSTDAVGNSTLFTYSASNRLTSFTDARGNTTSYQYDANDNITRITYADGTFDQYGYDGHGNLTSWTNGRGQSLQYAYNSLGLVTSKTYADSSVVTFNYDPSGLRLLNATDSTGTCAFTYNPQDLIATFADPYGHTLAFTYNSVGQRLTSTDQLGYTVNYGYDELGRLQKLTDGSNGLIVKYTYDAAGRLSREDKGNGTFTTYAYDPNDNVTNITHHKDATTANSSFDYTYDSMNRVTTMTTSGVETDYGYDAVGQLTSVATPSRLIQYVYDAVGNRVSVTDNGVTTNYSVDNRNRYTSAGAATFTYDLDGNLLTKTVGGVTTNFTFNQESQLVGAATPAQGDSWTYQIDPFGQRVATTHNAILTRHVVDPFGFGNVAAEYDGTNNLVAHYVYGLGLVSRADAANAPAYYDFDQLGSTIGITDSSKNYINRYSYLPFGETTTALAAINNPFTFDGEAGVSSDADGRFDMRRRAYDSATGAFVSDDPIGLSGGDPNLRSYVGNDPVNWLDEDGLRRGKHGKHGGHKPGHGGGKNGKACHAHPAGHGGQGGHGGGHGIGDAFGHWAAETAAHGLAHLTPLGHSMAGAFSGILGAAYGYAQLAGAWFNYQVSAVTNQMNSFNAYVSNYKGSGSDSCEPPPPPPPAPPGGSAGGSHSDNQTPHDPNELIGPAGFGASGFVTPDAALPYTILFENEPSASLPAQAVTVTHTLDANLDLDTFRLTGFGFGKYRVEVPGERDNYTTRIDDRAQSGLFVDISASLDHNTRVLTIVYESIDPTTLDRTADPLAGFLPPDNAAKDGQGYITFSVKAENGLSTGAQITGNSAQVVFDNLAPIDTNTTLNTIDAGAPTATVTALPDVETALTFPVGWTGQDDAGGSGVATFDVYVSDNNGPWTLWQNQTAALSANFTGQLYHSYSFYAVGYDNVGNVEPNIAATEAVTIATDGAYARNDVYGADASKTLTVSAKTGLLANDPKKAGKTYTVQAPVTNPAHGTLTLKPDGSFVYVPNGTFTGLDSFTYQTKDSDGVLGNVATVTLATQLVNFNTVKVSAPEAKGTAKLIVALRKPATAVTTVDYALLGGTATPGADFDATPATVTFQPGEKTKTILIPVVNDTIDEPDQTFQVMLQNPSGAVVGMKSTSTVTIKDNDAPPTVGFSVATSSFGEGAGAVTIAVTLSAASEKTVSVKFAASGGTATNGTDYTLTAGTLTFAPGETTKLITLTITQDTIHEANETVLVKLSKPTNAKLGLSALHTLTITDDDP